MTAKNAVRVGADIVREWHSNLTADEQATLPAMGRRGRPHPDIAAAFAKAHKGRKVYVPGEAPEPTREVRIRFLDKRGRVNTKVRRVTTAEARAALGQDPSTKGRISWAKVAEALSEVPAEPTEA